MARHAFSRLYRTAFGLALLLVSQLSLSGQICHVVGASVVAGALSPAHSWASQDRSIGDQGCCVSSDAENVICVPRGSAPISAVLTSGSPTFTPAAAGADMLPSDRAALQSACPPSVTSVTPHPPFSVLFCRYLN